MIKISEIAEKFLGKIETKAPEVKADSYEKLTKGLSGDNSLGNEGLEVQYQSASTDSAEVADSKEKGKTEYQYGKDGKMESSVTKNDKGQITKHVYYEDGKAEVEEFEYDNKGNVSKEKTTRRDGTTQEIEYKYDKDGRVSKETIINSDGSREVVTYKYDAKGRIVGKTEQGVNSNGSKIDISETYGYDKNGRINEITDKDGNKRVYNYKDDCVTTVTVLDKDGNIVEESKISNPEEGRTLAAILMYPPNTL